MKHFARVLAGLAVVACSSSGPPGEGNGIGGMGSHLGTGGATSDAKADTWATFAEGFFVKYCVVCHDGTQMTNGMPIVGDFRSEAEVTRHQTDIRCGVARAIVSGCEQSKWPPKQFPAGNGPKPTDDERDRLVAWIEAGLP